MNAQTASMMISFILRLLQFRRIMIDQMNVLKKIVRIEADISSYRITTIELQMNFFQTKEYNKIHRILNKQLKENVDAKTNEKFINMISHRKLCHVILNIALYSIIRNDKKYIHKKINRIHLNDDYEAFFYHFNTRTDDHFSSYRNRIIMILYINNIFSKFQWLTETLQNLCIVRNEKIIIFLNWSIILWNVIMYVVNLNINIIDIRFQHSQIERKIAVNKFNSKKDSVRILIIFTKITSTNVNLQFDCHHVIFLNIFFNANTVLQAIDRIYRLNQFKSSQIFMIILNQIYDQILQSRTINKMINFITDQSQIDVIKKLKNSLTINSILNMKFRIWVLKKNKIAKLYKKMLKQRCSRRTWIDFVELIKENELTTSKSFSQRKIRNSMSRTKLFFTSTFLSFNFSMSRTRILFTSTLSLFNFEISNKQDRFMKAWRLQSC